MEQNEATIRVHALVSGMVQGVGYRYFAYRSARRIGVTGWVRNLRNGDVEAEAQGTPESVDAFVAELRIGPQYSRVDQAIIKPIDIIGETTFRVLG